MLRLLTHFSKSLFSKRIIYQDECNKIIADTAQEIAKIAAITLGPMGRNVVIEDDKNLPRITKDGVTVVKHIEYEDRLKDAVCTLIKKSVNSTNRFAGDGTTTSTLLIGQIVKEGRKMIESGVSVKEIKDGLFVARNIGIDFIKMASRRISQEQDFYRVAMIATKGDKRLSTIISEAVFKSDLIKIQKSQTNDSYAEYYTGVKMVAGLAHPDFKNKGDRLQLDYPLVLLDKKGIKSVQQILPVLELAKKARKAMLLVSTNISDSVLSTLIYNIRKNIVEVYPLILKQYGPMPQQYFKQLSKTTGAVIFDHYSQHDLKQVKFQHLGKAVRVSMDLLETTVTGKSRQKCSNAVIYAGGPTEAIGLQVYDKLVDALNSVQTSKKHGVVAGGGVTYWRLADLLDQYQGQNSGGVKLLARALRAPRQRLVQALPEYYMALGGKGWQGFNFRNKKVEDMFEAGVIDSAIVGENVLVDSISLSHMLLDISVCVMRQSLNNESSEEVNQIQSTYQI